MSVYVTPYIIGLSNPGRVSMVRAVVRVGENNSEDIFGKIFGE
jgi:hypothetical protein